MPRQASHARQVPTLGESPAQARERMAREAAAARDGAELTPPTEADVPVEGPHNEGVEVEGELSPLQIAEIEAKVGGFQGQAVSGGITEERGDREDLPSPARAMDMIREQGNRINTLTAELDAALNLVARYRAQYGDLD